ncbi:YwqH-like family protein [Lentibacillus jeotgali]|uniref:YwqH-like family protein n=1 Tax=Lentibacillus jeotgali TaxID=558169 RepID=UPI0002627480|nr:DUF5082 family protein [Lentibacillus jeotgali]
MTSLSTLRSRKTTVLQGMDNSRTQISILEDKISRLQKASSTLSNNISQLETTKSTVDTMTVDGNRWKGESEQKFEDNYSAYKESVNEYARKVNDAKETIDEDIRRYGEMRANYVAGLDNLEHTLNSLDNQIKAEERK